MPMLCNPKKLRLNIIPFPDKAQADKTSVAGALSDRFVAEQLALSEENVGEIIVSIPMRPPNRSKAA